MADTDSAAVTVALHVPAEDVRHKEKTIWADIMVPFLVEMTDLVTDAKCFDAIYGVMLSSGISIRRRAD